MRRAIALFFSLTGCATVFLQEDGFRTRIPRECVDESTCETMLAEARRRQRGCAENTIGKVKCDDAEADTQHVAESLERFRRERSEREAQAKGEQKAAEAALQREEQAEEQRRKQALAEEREESRRKAEEAKNAEMRQVSELSLWQSTQGKACADTWSHDGCKEPPLGTALEGIEKCRAHCVSRANEAASGVYGEALNACVQTYVAAQGKVAAHCALSVPAGADPKYKDFPATCRQRCQEHGKAKLAELAAERARKAAAAAPPAAPPAGDGGGNERVKCCDGTLSPTCTYGRPSLRGCCSHHGGVC